jgi:integrase
MTKQLNDGSDVQGCASNVTQTRKSVQAGRYAKDNLLYWMDAVRKPSYTRDGKVFTSPSYAVSIQWRGKRKNLSLGTGNQKAAAAKARDIYQTVTVQGWDAALEQLRPAMPTQDDPTVGEIIVAIKAVADAKPRTLEAYCRAFRRVVCDVCGIPRESSRFDLTGGRERWLERVNKVKFSELTTDRLQKWKQAFLGAAGQDPRSQHAAKVSFNSLLRAVRCLFSPKILEHVSLKLPNPLPFAGLKYLKCGVRKYQSTIDARKLLAEAKAELPDEQLKIFLLALCVGLRRSEIDLLEWSSFIWDRNIIRVEMTDYFEPKTDGSSGDVLTDAKLMSVFRGWHARRTGRFVVESDASPKNARLYKAYRCMQHFQRLTAWLRFKGVKGHAPLHALRKECGSLINERFGIHAASRALRHSSIVITSSVYADNRLPATSGLFADDEPETKVVPMKPGPEQKASEKSA